MKQTIKALSAKKQRKIVSKTDTNALPKSVGYPKAMQGVILNLKTGKYEFH